MGCSPVQTYTPSSTEERLKAMEECWHEQIGQALHARGEVHIALSAAPTLLPWCRHLAATDWPWSTTRFYLVEDVWVPRGHAHSHYRQVYEAFYPHRIHLLGWETEAIEPENACRRYEKKLLHSLGNPPRLDLALLESDADGRIAALFPGSPALAIEDQWAAPSPVPHTSRMALTLTLPTLCQARACWIMTNQNTLSPPPNSPLRRLVEENANLTVFELEKAATLNR